MCLSGLDNICHECGGESKGVANVPVDIRQQDGNKLCHTSLCKRALKGKSQTCCHVVFQQLD